jgi:hypothetical protein
MTEDTFLGRNEKGGRVTEDATHRRQRPVRRREEAGGERGRTSADI